MIAFASQESNQSQRRKARSPLFCSEIRIDGTHSIHRCSGTEGYVLLFMRIRTAFMGCLDLGTTDNYFFLITSLLGRPVITQHGRGKSVESDCFLFLSCLHQTGYERDGHGMKRGRHERVGSVNVEIPSALFLCPSMMSSGRNHQYERPTARPPLVWRKTLSETFCPCLT